ncbi:tudor domain-containing protein 7-like isoform X2 [Nasonia vitripennis]|uniref:Tudor domain-containing protein n=1 Tax=Nasonia vitripennis TaxID=7425 RepID=A0A7M7IXI4_NASVI|nr:tudor domain-containing protein 7-like isoform X2 [Nasonia vitripennis]
MDLSEVSLAANGRLCSLKSVKKETPKKRIPLVPYVPPHRRNSSSTNYDKLATKQSDLNYSDHSYASHKLPKTEKMIYSTNDLSDYDLSVCSRTNTNLKEDIAVHEKQTFKFSNENIEKTNIEIKRSVSQSTIESDDYSGTESFEMYNTAEELTSESIISCNEDKESDINAQSPFITEYNASNTKVDLPQKYLNLPVVEKYGKTLSKVKSNDDMHNEGSNLSISATHSNGKVFDKVEKVKKDNLIIGRILDLANVYMNVTFKVMLTELYSKKYSKHIPSTVLQEINFVVSVNNESKIKDVTPTNKKIVNIGPKFLTSEDIGSTFLVKIYNCKSITEIWGKITNATNLKKLDELLKEMKKFYDSEKMVASSIKEGGFYAVYKDDFWHRVKCLKCDKSTALVLFIDQGDEYTFSLENIFELHNKFVLIPAQAIRMSLSDLEDISDCYEAFLILNDKLLEKTVYANMLAYKDNCCTVKLYLKIYEENINIADLVIEQLFKTFLNPKSSIQTEELMHVNVSYISDNKIFVQLFKSNSYAYFTKLLRNATKYLDNKNLQRVQNLNENAIYLVQNPDKKTWYRAKIMKFKSEVAVEALLIDTGANICLNKEDFYHLEKLSSILTKYPEQAIEIQVHELSKFYEHETLEHFQKLTKCPVNLFGLFITKTLENNNIPTIRLFKKESDNSLIPINDKLLLNQKTQGRSMIIVPLNKTESSDNDITHNYQKMLKMREMQRSLSLLSLSTVLDPPKIPKHYCGVHIISADNPSNFTIQLLSSKCGELKKLGCELSDACNSYKGSPLTVKTVKIGQLYAAKYDDYDNKWYRVYVCQLMTDTKSANVYYCDYGYYKEVNIENIVPLVSQFHQLPYQAVWAQLYGIKPIFERWTLDDASRFKDLTQLKNFACIIKSKESFKPQCCQTLIPITVETVYSLELVDNSTEDDIYIADILVEERRALKCK